MVLNDIDKMVPAIEAIKRVRIRYQWVPFYKRILDQVDHSREIRRVAGIKIKRTKQKGEGSQ